MTKTDREVLSRRLSELKKVGLIRRVKKVIQTPGHVPYTFNEPRSTYIINPEVLRPLDHDEAEYLWEQCR